MVEAAKQRAAEVQALSEAHILDLTAVGEDFQAKMKSATTSEQRKAIRQEYLQTRRAKQEEFQRKRTEMKAR